MTEKYQLRIDEHLDHGEATALWHRSADATVYNHPAWWQSAHEAYGDGRDLMVLSLSRGGRLVAFWPLWMKNMGPKDGFACVVEPVGARMSDYIMPLMDASEPLDELLEALLRPIRRRLGPWTMFLWSRATNCAGISEAMDQIFAGQRFLVHRKVRPALRMSLPSSYAALEARWSRNLRRDLRRRIRRLSELGKLHLRVAKTRDEIRERFPNLIALHRAEWHGRGETSEFDDHRTARFYANIINDLPLDLLHYSELCVDGKAASAQFNYVFDNVLRAYKSAFDLKMAKFSPGKIHDAQLAGWCIEDKLSAIDFMEGLEDYKYMWADGQTDCVTHAVSPVAGLPLWMWNTKLRKLIVEYKV